MNKLFGKKTIIDRLGETVGLKPKRSSTGLKSGVAAAAGIAALTAVSAVVSALRGRQSESDGKRDAR